jgi:hypothetical protein
VAKEWVTHFLSGPLMFFVYFRAKEGETKLEAFKRLIEHMEQDNRVPGGLWRKTTTLHLDIDTSDSRTILRELRRSFGLLRAFKWDSKGSLLLQLSDLLLGIAQADRASSLDTLDETASKAKQIKKEVLDHARSTALQKRSLNKINAVIEIDETNRVWHCLLGD